MHTRCPDLFGKMFDALAHATSSGHTHPWFDFYMARVGQLDNSTVGDAEWLRLLETEKCEAVHTAQRCGKLLILTARVHGKHSLAYNLERSNLQMHKTAALVLIDYYKERVNKHAVA